LGCLFAISLLIIVVSIGGWFGRRVYLRQAAIRRFEQLRSTTSPAGVVIGEYYAAWITTKPAQPVWLHDVVRTRLGETFAVGFQDAAFLFLNDTATTDTDLQHLRSAANLEHLNLGNTLVTDVGLQHDESGADFCRWAIEH
jgi:hypothetical protein